VEVRSTLCFSEADVGDASEQTRPHGSEPKRFHAPDFFNEAFGGKAKNLDDRLRGGLGPNAPSRPH
jgi:hypothetical protein